MAVLHFLNVLDGDCHIVKHASGHVTVIDCNNAKHETEEEARMKAVQEVLQARVQGNFNQKANPVNPIAYMNKHGYNSVFRFILTHPDMDHMGGIKAFFGEFSPVNLWDTDNNEEKNFEQGSPYNEDDWKFYKKLRDGDSEKDPKRLTNYARDKGKYWSEDEKGNKPGDALNILAPTKALVREGNDTDDNHVYSYVILYRAAGGKVLFCGDSHDKTWEYILKHHENDVRDIKVLIAPHHGRDSERSFEFLKIVNPTLTLIGNADSKHLAYDQYRKYGTLVTNNQANCVIIEVSKDPMKLYVTNKSYAKKFNDTPDFSDYYKGYFCYEF